MTSDARRDKKTRSIVLLATGWGTKFGGPNSFNLDLCVSLAHVLSIHQVICVVLDARDLEVEQAARNNVTLLSVNLAGAGQSDDLGLQPTLQCLRSAGVDLRTVDWFIGHDIKTGQTAVECARQSGCQAALFMHTSYSDFSHLKHPESQAGQLKTREQRSLFGSADVAFGIGPLLFDRLREFRIGAESRTVRVVPGLPAPLDGIPVNRMSAVAFGRLQAEEALVKQAPLVVAGFALAVSQGIDAGIEAMRDARLKIIGIPRAEHDQIRRLAEKHANRVVNIELQEFVEDRDQLVQHLRDCNLVMMLSWHEGFGLVGWEAIGYGIPLIVSTGSGMYRLLEEIGGRATGAVCPLDVKATASGRPATKDRNALKQAIIRCALHLPLISRDAKLLSSMLRTECGHTWVTCAKTVARALQLAIRDLDTIAGTTVVKSALAETPDLQRVAIIKQLRHSEVLVSQGEYANALKALNGIDSLSVVRYPELHIGHLLQQAECILRLNRYDEAEGLATKVIALAAGSAPMAHIDALGVVNVVRRDRGDYRRAIEVARTMVELAEAVCPVRLPSAQRKLARSLAPAGEWEEAVSLADGSLQGSSGDPVDESKALLALGEAYRHGLNQEEAVRYYLEARNRAALSAHTDCWLWANLGMADSLFLIDDLDSAEKVIHAVTGYVRGSQQPYPLETLHARLSLIAVARVKGTPDLADERELLAAYDVLGIAWPQQYLVSLGMGTARVPKRL